MSLKEPSRARGEARAQPQRQELAHAAREAAGPELLPSAPPLQRVRRAPDSLTSAEVLQLQRALGNRATHQLLAEARQPPPAQASANPSGLPEGLKSGIERLSGLSMDDVSVHYDSPQPSRVHALAHTQGTAIHLGPGQRQHLPHEAWHVVQQKQGRVQPTVQVDGVDINDEPSLEREADVMGSRAAMAQAGGSDEPTAPTRSSGPGSPAVMQGVFSEQEKLRISQLSSRKRVRLLSKASEEDLKDYLDSRSHNPLAAEEIEEIRRRRERRALRKALLAQEVDESAEEQAALRVQDEEEESELDELSEALESLSLGSKPKVKPPSPEVDELSEALGSLSLGSKPKVKPSSPEVDELSASLGALSLGPKSSEGPAPMEVDDISIHKTDYRGEGDVEMEDVHAMVDVEMSDVDGRVDIDMEDVDGFVAMDVDGVHGDVAIHLSNIHGAVRLTLMDVELARPGQHGKTEYGKMDIDIADVSGKLVVELFPGPEPMQLELGPVGPEEVVTKRIDKRKAKEAPKRGAPDKKPRIGSGSEESPPEEVSDPSVEALTEQFSELTVSFRSDIDHKEHQIYPSPNYGEVIVESNPTPLKTIIAAKAWQGVAIAAGVLVALGNLQTDADNALKAFATARTKTAGNTLRKALKAIAKQLKTLSANIDLPVTKLAGTNVGNDSPPTEGLKVVADPLSLNSKHTGHKPHDGRLMKSVRALAGPESKSYKQMHLLNDNVFGPGELWNLTPGPAQSNVDMEKDIETHLKRAVIDKGLVISFTATVNYKNDPTKATDKEINQNADKYRFLDIQFEAGEYEFDSGTKTWKKLPTPVDQDLKDINKKGKIAWKYGNLTPLVPKPKIFDLATTAQNLKDAGIPAAAANRIYDYVQAKKPAPLTGADKKGQLAEDIKSWDGKKKISTNWNASAVLWT